MRVPRKCSCCVVRERTNRKREQVRLWGLSDGVRGIGGWWEYGEEVEMRRRGRGTRWVGWVQVQVCDELKEGVSVSVAFVLEFVCVYRTPLF